MDSQNPGFVRPPEAPAIYRLVRAIVRLWVRLFFPGLRLLNRKKLERPGPAILLVTHPRSLRVAFLLLSALDRPVRCLLPAGRIKGFFKKLAGRALGIRSFESLPEEQDSLLDPCLKVLADQGIIAVFAEPFPQNGGPRAPVADFAARLALEAILRGEGQPRPALYPVHCFLGARRARPEHLAYVDGPIQAQQFLPKVGEDAAEASLELAEAVQRAIEANIFGLAEPELEHFGRELQDFSREHLQQQWSGLPDWKQRPEQLHLSSAAGRWLVEQNSADPAHLVELRESLAAYREERRRSSMRRLMVQISGPWQASRLRVVGAWIETALGFPVALYGLLNHLPAGIVLRISGLFKSSPKRDPKAEWLARIFVVLSFYTLQVFLAHFWWGRATAGYYALTLPASGAYLWRYGWLLRNRSHVLLLQALHPAGSARLRKRQEKILAGFTRAIERSMQARSTPFAQVHDLAE